MKKLLPVALLAALSCSFVACSEGDEACFTPSYLAILDDIGGMASANSAIGSVADLPSDISTIDKTVVENAVAPCKSLYDSMKSITDKNSGVTSESIKAEHERFQNTSGLCRAAVGLNGALKSLSFVTAWSNVKASVEYCAQLAGAAGALGVVGFEYGAEELTTSFTTLDGWSNILQTAADATSKAAADQDANKAN